MCDEKDGLDRRPSFFLWRVRRSGGLAWGHSLCGLGGGFFIGRLYLGEEYGIIAAERLLYADISAPFGDAKKAVYGAISARFHRIILLSWQICRIFAGVGDYYTVTREGSSYGHGRGQGDH